jgi:hypothetical protein
MYKLIKEFDKFSYNGGIPEEEDALIAKRQLIGWSCASCEKSLVNMQGNHAEYQTWNKMPVRDANTSIPTNGENRISKVGIHE